MQGRVEKLKSKRPAVTGLRGYWVEMIDIFLEGEQKKKKLQSGSLFIHLLVYF